MPAANAASKARNRALAAVKKYKQRFKPGDITVLLLIPAHRQGQVSVVLEGVTPKQSAGILSSLQSDLKDVRLQKVLEAVEALHAAQEALGKSSGAVKVQPPSVVPVLSPAQPAL